MLRLSFFGCVCLSILLSAHLSFGQRTSSSSSGESVASLSSMLEKARSSLELNPDSSLAYARSAASLSKDLNNILGQAEAAYLEASALSIKEEYDAARSAFSRAINRFTRAEDSLGLFQSMLGMGMIEMETRNYSSSLQQFRVAESYARSPGEWGRIHTLNGLTFQRLGSFDLAYDHYQKALLQYSEAEDPVGMADAFSNLGGIMFDLGDFDVALLNYNNALELQVEQGDRVGEMASRCKIGMVQLRRKQYRSAQVSHQTSLGIAYELGMPRGIADNCMYLGEVALGAGESDSAAARFAQALEIWEGPGMSQKIAEARLGLAKAALENKNHRDAIALSESAIKAANEVQAWEITSEARMVQSRASEGMRKYKEALAYERLFDEVQAKIQEQEKRNKALEMRVRFEHETEMRKIAVQKRIQEADLEAQGDQLKRNRLIGFGMAGMIIVIGLFSFFLYRTARKRRRTNLLLEESSVQLNEKNAELKATQKELEKANNNLESLVDERTEALKEAVEGLVMVNQDLDTFIYRASHDLLGPIARLKGLSMLLRATAGENKYATLIDDVTVYMDKGLRKLIMVHDIRKPHSQMEAVDLDEIIAQAQQGLRDTPGVTEPIIHVHNEIEGPLMMNPKLAKVILENILENALVFRKDSGHTAPEVTLSLKKEGGQLVINAHDEGIGIPQEIQDKVFEIFYRGSERSKGSGTGLYLVKLSAEHMGGTVELDSVEGEFTSVTIRIPLREVPATEAEAQAEV